MADRADMSLLLERSLAALRRQQDAFDAALGEASLLVRQAVQQHADGYADEARASIKDAGDLLFSVVGNSDAVSGLEDALGVPLGTAESA